MKSFKVSLMTLVAILIAFSSCSKYEEGPAMSLLTKKARITGEWKVVDVIMDGTSLADLTDYAGTTTYEKDGTGEYTSSILGVSFEFEWEFSEDKEAIKTRSNVLGVWSSWEETDILKLTNKEFWTTETDLGITTEIHYEKK